MTKKETKIKAAQDYFRSRGLESKAKKAIQKIFTKMVEEVLINMGQLASEEQLAMIKQTLFSA